MSVTISAKVSEELNERIDEAREEGESKSKAIGRLIRTGLDGESSGVGLNILLLWWGSIFIAASPDFLIEFRPFNISGVWFGLAVMLVGVVLSTERGTAAAERLWSSLGSNRGTGEGTD